MNIERLFATFIGRLAESSLNIISSRRAKDVQVLRRSCDASAHKPEIWRSRLDELETNQHYTLSVYRQHKSIKEMQSISLPQFVILTGRNGSGKSHFLEAISTGSIRTDITEEPRKEIGLFTWNTIVPNGSGSYSLGDWSAAVESILKNIENTRDNMLSNVRNNIESNGGDASLLDSITTVSAMMQMVNKGIARPEEHAALNAFSASIQQYRNSFLSLAREQSLVSRRALASIWQRDPKILALGDRATIRDLLDGYRENSIEVFQQAFSRIFIEYLKKWQENQLLSATGLPHLTDDEFISRHHIAPWDFVNSILEKSRLPFRIDRPQAARINESYEPKLVKQNGSEMRFEDLSSGEKVLMSFAFCVYNAYGEDAVFPKILLLDEVDAPLHPEMVDVVLKVIKETLVDANKIKVILSTHKPTTVALAPEESIYEIIDSNRINKISREKAVSILTVGVPTMAFTTDLRQQVFTEAEVDASVLSSFYQIYKSELPSDRSLVFLPSGRRTVEGDKDSGCSRVIDLVGKLRDNGVSTVSGIIDWDKKNKLSSGVLVLCEGTRYSIENLVLDPLILASLIARDFRDVALKTGILNEQETYLEMLGWTHNRWQSAVEIVSVSLFGEGFERVPTTYKNGMSLEVPKEALLMQGHHLRNKLDNHWNGITKKHPGDKLILHICRNLLLEIKNIAPVDIYITVEKLSVYNR